MQIAAINAMLAGTSGSSEHWGLYFEGAAV